MDAKYESVSLRQEETPLSGKHNRHLDHDDDDFEDDRHSHSSSSSLTEVDESFLGDDATHTAKWQSHDDVEAGTSAHARRQRQRQRQRQQQQQQKRQPRSSSALSWCRAVFVFLHWGLDTILLLAILGLVVRQQFLLPKSPSSASTQLGDVGSDFTGVGPQIDRKITRFQSDQSYAPMNMSDFFRDEVLQQWNKLMPVGMGFVWVNDTHRYHDLPHPIDWPDKTVFTTSVTHQIHCLFTITQTYAGLATGNPLPPDHHWHMVHCIDYMREAILCSADMALEGHETTFPDDNGGSDGWDSTHVCRDYNQVKTYLESVRAYDDQLIY